ncbi:hypothetical protein chiPu_0012491 [Chiloscyllium punctatum]|uniref:Uncharacterized protein n=1 Tax=Chiloscyllium punctatum TaxID=137246 RepID=A0A401SUG6_CHIPU|nr:hypothetical protein [Chiloscyllium punctatum]
MKNTKGKIKVTLIILLVLLSVFLIFLSALLIRTYTFSAAGNQDRSSFDTVVAGFAANFSKTERTRLLDNLKGALRIPTVNRGATDFDSSSLEEFGNFLPKVFPTVFSSNLVQHEIIANYSHLFTVRGSNDSLQPYMLIAHLDVVPALEEEWDVPPFSAEERDGYLYGRGAMDDKASLMGILQALEFLLKRGYKPCRSFYIGIGHDEEVGGNNGARNIATVLQSRGIKLSFLLDEGSFILSGIVPGLNKNAAIIATSEKGFATISLSVSVDTGHSSMPPKETSIGILAAAVSKLEKNPMPRMFGQGPERGLFEHLSPQLRFPLNMVMANLWLFSPIVSRMMEKKPSTNSLVRTTTAVTEFYAGIKIKAIRVFYAPCPGLITAVSKSRDRKCYKYKLGLCIANTDTRHYLKLTKQLYRFIPMILKQEDLTRIHGVNERISIKNYEEIVEFYFRLLQNSDLSSLPPSHISSCNL